MDRAFEVLVEANSMQNNPSAKPETIEMEDGVLVRPATAWSLLVLAHGAGAGMRHAFMDGIARALAREGVASWRWEFPYMQAGSRRPDRPEVALPAVRAAVERGRELVPELPVFAGGKSFGGRMTTQADAQEALPAEGIVLLGFPLHPAGRPGTERAEHLAGGSAPLLFLQGDRDALAGLDLLRPVVSGLGDRATLHVVDGADHGFHVLKRSGRTDADVLREIASTAAAWLRDRVGVS
jgi:predicted alpha/beta-hydrolase family hydrolase